MIVNMGGWLAANWKVLAVIAPLVLSSGFGAYNYVEGVDTRMDVIEQKAELRTLDVDDQLDRIEADVEDIKCMSITHAQGGDPLDCVIVK